jgi:hypothetical protein
MTERHIWATALITVAAYVGFIATTQAAKPPSETVCFPRATWDADPGDRPCSRIVSVAEDASTCLRIGPADRSVSRRVCVGNPYDKQD